MTATWHNQLWFGDNLGVLRNEIGDSGVDLVYLDPPFNSKASYNVLFRDKSGVQSPAQITAFEDTWIWSQETADAFEELVTTAPKRLADLMRAFRLFLGGSDMMAYLTMMAPRLVELHRVLKPTGSLYLHCDVTAAHYLKLMLDAIFDPRRFLNEITWKRTTAHNDPKRYGRVQDRILFYSKGPNKTFNRIGGNFSPEQMARYKYTAADGRRYRAENLTAPHFSPTRTVEWRGQHPGRDRQWRFGLEELEDLWQDGRILKTRDGRPRKDGLIEYLDDAEEVGPALQDLWTDIALAPTAAERLPYPTQKPEALLDRIIQTSSNEGELILDPFAGCGTSVAVAERLHRRWIGIDITYLAIDLVERRLQASFPGDLAPMQVRGVPEDLGGAAALAQRDRHQFELWAVGKVNAQSAKKKGADQGVDGVAYFFDDSSGHAKKVIVQVKSGGVGAQVVRDLHGTIQAEGGVIGVMITLRPHTPQMVTAATAAGHYTSSLTGQRYPAIQLLTAQDLLDGRGILYPSAGDVTHKVAPRRLKDLPQQGKLL